MIKTRFSHAYLVGRVATNIDDATLKDKGWRHVAIDEKTYKTFCSYYYQSHVNAMIEAKSPVPGFLSGIRHYRYTVQRQVVLLGREYRFCICHFHLFFLPVETALIAIEIDDTNNTLDALTWGHSQLMGWSDRYESFPVWMKMLFRPLEDLLATNDITQLCADGNKLKLYQIVNLQNEKSLDKDALLYELGTSSPIGCVNNHTGLTPSREYYNHIMKQNTVSAFIDWKALALNDSFTMLDVAEKSLRYDSWESQYWLWLHPYFRLIYLRCFFEKTFCLSRNKAYRMGSPVENLSAEIADMEKFYFYNNISYNFLPNMLYEAMVKGMNLTAEREEISQQIKERAKEQENKMKEERDANEKRLKSIADSRKAEEDRKMTRLSIYVAIFAVFSVAWDLYCLFMKVVEEKSLIAIIFMIIGIVLAAICVVKLRNNERI